MRADPGIATLVLADFFTEVDRVLAEVKRS
jgi:hypothetical protein